MVSSQSSSSPFSLWSLLYEAVCQIYRGCWITNHARLLCQSLGWKNSDLKIWTFKMLLMSHKKKAQEMKKNIGAGFFHNRFICWNIGTFMILLLNHWVLQWFASAWQGKTHFSKFIVKLSGPSELLCLMGNSGSCASLPVRHIVIAESNEKSQREIWSQVRYIWCCSTLQDWIFLLHLVFTCFFSHCCESSCLFFRLMTLHFQYLAQSLWRWIDIMITFSLKCPLSREQQEYRQRSSQT